MWTWPPGPEAKSTSPISSPEAKSTLPIYDPDDESTWPPFVSSRRAQSQSQSQSHLQSPQGKQRSQPVYPWSAHAPPLGQSPSPFLRHAHALSPSATAAGELFLF